MSDDVRTNLSRFDFHPQNAIMTNMNSELNIVWQKADQPVIATDRKGFAAQMAVSIVRHLLDIDPDLKHMREQGHHVFIHVWPKQKNIVAYDSLAEMSSVENAETYIITIMEWTFGIIKTPDTISVFEYPGHNHPQ